MKRFNLISILLLHCVQILAQIETPEYDDSTKTSNAQIIEQDITSEEKYLAFRARGKISVWNGCGEGGLPRDHIAKPFIWVEGINLTPNNLEKSHDPVYPEVYLELLRDGFDVIQVDFNNSPQWIERNAELIITLIHEIQTEMDANGSAHEIVIMGESMGALVVRYALAKMENNGENHNVRLFVSYDGPHNGANVPWGLQYMASDILKPYQLVTLLGGSSLVAGITNTFASLFDKSGSSSAEAAYQLLMSSPFPEARLLRQGFTANLDAQGGYPENCRMVAIANGSNNGVGLPQEGENYQILRITSPGLLAFLSDRRAYAAPGRDVSFLGVDLGRRIVYSNLSTSLIKSKVRFYPTGLQNWDVAPGGTFFRDNNEGILRLVYRTRPFTFIPTVSSLGFDTDDPFFNVSGIEGFGTVLNWNLNNGMVMNNIAYTFNNDITEFDAIYADDDNDAHVTGIEINWTDKARGFFLSEVSPDRLPLQDKTVTGTERKIYEAQTSVTLGREHSPAFPVGDVTFESGSQVVVRASNEIVWENGFEAEAGSNVDFRIEFYECN